MEPSGRPAWEGHLSVSELRGVGDRLCQGKKAKTVIRKDPVVLLGPPDGCARVHTRSHRSSMLSINKDANKQPSSNVVGMQSSKEGLIRLNRFTTENAQGVLA